MNIDDDDYEAIKEYQQGLKTWNDSDPQPSLTDEIEQLEQRLIKLRQDGY
jgi:hypothetical protein